METLAYISIIIASVLYFIGFIMLFRYKRDKIKYLEEQLTALNNILDSSDKMVDELNNLSDYVTTNIEEKTIDLKKLLTIADEKIKDFKLASNYNLKPSNSNKYDNGDISKNTNAINKFEQLIDDISKINKPEFNKIESPKKSFSAVIGAYENNKAMYNTLKSNENDIESESENMPKEAIVEDTNISRKTLIEKLLSDGLSTTEIAKQLGVGKGEIELIIGLKK